MSGTNREREREKARARGEPVKVKLDGPKKTTLVKAELIETEKVKMVELLRGNKFEFIYTLRICQALIKV